MRIAVFALGQEEDFSKEATGWLQRFVTALAQDERTSAIMVGTNLQGWAAVHSDKVTTQYKSPPVNFWKLWQQARQWRSQLKSFGADKVFYFGLSSELNVQQPSLLYVTPADVQSGGVKRKKNKLLRQQQLWVASTAAAQTLTQILHPNLLPVAVAYGAPPAASLVEADTQLVKDRFTDGAEYFLYHGPLENKDDTLRLLKAFSRFKHRQKSGWKLLLLPSGSGVPRPLQQLLATYKFRNDVVMLADETGAELVQSLYAAAHCFLQPAAPKGMGTNLLSALAWRLPVVAPPQCSEWAGGAGLYFEEGNETELAAQLMAIYKDEALHARLSREASEKAAAFSWQPLVDRLLG